MNGGDSLRVLLIEDELTHCQKYVDYNDSHGKVYVLSVANGCSQGLALLESFQPDVVLLDLMLNKSDGSGIEFLLKYKRLSLLKKPELIVITSILEKQMHEKVLKLGVEFIITKDKPDYSPKFVFDFIRDILSASHKTGSKYNSEDIIYFYVNFQ